MDQRLSEQEADDARREQLLLGVEEFEELTELTVMEENPPKTLVEMVKNEDFRREFNAWLDERDKEE